MHNEWGRSIDIANQHSSLVTVLPIVKKQPGSGWNWYNYILARD